jgi:hypothetical protein
MLPGRTLLLGALVACAAAVLPAQQLDLGSPRTVAPEVSHHTTEPSLVEPAGQFPR